MIIVLIHVVGGALLLRLDLNNAPSLYFPDQAPATVLERELRQEFPNDEFLIGLFQGDNLYEAERLKAIDQVAGDMARHVDVDRVFSVTRMDHIAGSADGFVVEPLIDVGRIFDAVLAGKRQDRIGCYEQGQSGDFHEIGFIESRFFLLESCFEIHDECLLFGNRG